MARFQDYRSDHDAQDIVEKFVEKFPQIFEGFDVNGIEFITTCKKKSRQALRLRSCGYPAEVFIGKPYIVEVMDEVWKKMSQKKKNQSVFHLMCAIPNGAFDPASKYYGKKVRPQIVMFDLEFAACGGVPSSMEEIPESLDPLEAEADALIPKSEDPDDIGEEAIPAEGAKHPVTSEAIASV
jgi:hypothetical protein